MLSQRTSFWTTVMWKGCNLSAHWDQVAGISKSRNTNWTEHFLSFIEISLWSHQNKDTLSHEHLQKNDCLPDLAKKILYFISVTLLKIKSQLKTRGSKQPDGSITCINISFIKQHTGKQKRDKTHTRKIHLK